MRKLLLTTALLILGAVFPLAASGQTVTAFKTGEQVTGMTKQCFYSFAGTQYTRTLRSIDLCPLSIQVPSVPSRPPSPPSPSPPVPGTVIAFKVGENITGMTKQCIYEFAGSRFIRTISAIDLCPLNIRVRP